MPSLDELIKQKVDLFESTPENLATASEKVQRKLWGELLPLVQTLEVDKDGNVAQSQKNIRKIGEITDKLQILLAGKEYTDAIKVFLADIDKGVVLTDEIARKIEASFEPSQVLKDILTLSKQNAINSLIGETMRSRVTLPFVEQLTTAIATRAPLRDTVAALKIAIEGSPDVDGRLLANVKTVAITAQAIADRSYAAGVAEAIGAVWYKYVGGIIHTSREFCENRNRKFFHIKEIQAWGEGKNAGGISDIKDGTWDGKKAGTDSRTIVGNLGGWGCRHSIIPVSFIIVPKDVVQRNIDNGNYKP